MTDTQRILDQSLLNAARINDITLVKQLLRKRASINAKDMHGKTPMHYAAAYGNTDLVKLLWENGARVDAEDDAGNTPLHCAITFREDEREVINMLCDYGAKVNAQNKLGQTPLRLSVRRQNIQAFETLLERGADVTLNDTFGDTVLLCFSSIAN